MELNRRTFGEADEGASGDIPEPMSPELDDSEVLEKLRSEERAEKLRHLFDDGDLSAQNGEHSDADLSLCGMLAFYTQEQCSSTAFFANLA